MPTTIDERIYACFAAATGLTDLLGTAAAGGPCAFPVEAPPAAEKPLLIWEIVATTPATTHGEGDTDSRLDMVRVQVTFLASTALEAAAGIYQARLALEGSTTLKGVMASEQTLPRSEDADCHGRTADFTLWNYPDS